MLVGASPSFLYSHAGSHTKSGCDGGQYRDKDVEDFTPECFVFHAVCVMSFINQIPLSRGEKNYSSSPSSFPSGSSLTYLTGTLLKLKDSSAPASTLPGRKMIFARLMRLSL